MGVDKIHDVGDWGGRGIALQRQTAGIYRKDNNPKHTGEAAQNRSSRDETKHIGDQWNYINKDV